MEQFNLDKWLQDKSRKVVTRDGREVEPASKDLEEAARHYLLNTHTSPLNNILHRADLIIEMQYHEDIENTFKAGAEWQKQQMMKDVLEGEYWIGEIHLDTPIIQGYDDGDIIKFIPIKDEQQ